MLLNQRSMVFLYTTSVGTFRTCKGLFKKICQRHSAGRKKSPFGGRFRTCFEAFHVVQSGYSRRVLKMDVSANLGGPANPVGAFLSRRPCWPPVCFWNILRVVWKGGNLKWLPSAVVFPMVCGEGCRSEFQPSYNSTACKIKGVLIGFLSWCTPSSTWRSGFFQNHLGRIF